MLTKETQKKERPSPADSVQTLNVFLPPHYVRSPGHVLAAPHSLLTQKVYARIIESHTLFPVELLNLLDMWLCHLLENIAGGIF